MIDRVELSQVVERPAPRRRRKPRRIRQVEHRVADGTKLDPLISRRQKTASPQTVIKRLIIGVARAARVHDHEGGEILVLASQSVGDPRADARPARELGSRLEESHGRVVIDRLGVHRPNEAKLVSHARGERQKLRNGRTALAVPRKGEPARRHRKAVLTRGHARQPLAHPDRIRKVHPLESLERRLVIEQIHLRRCT